MPYIKQEQRKVLDPHIEDWCKEIVSRVEKLQDISDIYTRFFGLIAEDLVHLCNNHNVERICLLAHEIFRFNDKNCGFLGPLNYCITKMIQIVPKKLVEQHIIDKELSYSLYALTVDALINIVDEISSGFGIKGVFEDIKDEYKARVGRPYESEKIKENGDCFETIYNNYLTKIYDNDDNFIGYILIDKG